MSININPALIANAIPYNSQSLVNKTSKISKHPVDPVTGKSQQYIRFVPLQMKFDVAACQFVDLSLVNNPAPMSQISSMYVDASGSLHDITVYFPDSGWSARVAFGDCVMLNPISSQDAPKFYISLDNGGSTDPKDVVNIFCCDSYIPPSQTSIFQRSIAYGYSQMFDLQPGFVQSAAFPSSASLATAPLILIDATQWYITMLDISVALVMANPTNGYAGIMQFFDGGTLFFQQLVTYTSTDQNVLKKLVTLAGLNYSSKGTGNLTVAMDNVVNVSTSDAVYNIFGGVLVT